MALPGEDVRSSGRRGHQSARAIIDVFIAAAPRGLYCGVVALLYPGLAAMALLSLVLLCLSFVDPPTSALMLRRQLEGDRISNTWVPLKDISPHLIRAVVSSEDARFCRHTGIDFAELDRALTRGGETDLSDVRGASTISMQVTKNLFLWPGRSLVRKGLELLITPLMELFWTKRRILEVYLNIAEWGPGIFGAEAAARAHFSKSARRLTPREAALLAAALPNPLVRQAGNPGPKTWRHARRIQRRMPGARAYVDCIQRR